MIFKIFREDRSVEGADCLDVKGGSLLQKALHLHAVLAHDAEIISSCFASPVLFNVQCAKFAKSVCRKENFIFVVVSDDDFRPVHHRCGDKGESVCAEGESVAFAHCHASFTKFRAEKLLHHHKGF